MTDRYQRAARAWHDSGVPVEYADPDREAQTVDALRTAIRRVPNDTAQRRRRQALFVLAAAALFTIGIGGIAFGWRSVAPRTAASPTLRARGPAALVIRDGETRFAEPKTETRLQQGDEVSVAANGDAQLALPSGAAVDVAATTRLTIASLERDEVIRLVRGSVSLRVPKLAPPHTLSVQAPDATVVVHGTRFSVSVEGDPPPARARTTVHVTEGEVAVVLGTGHVILRSGDSWHSPDDAARATEPTPSASGDSVAPTTSATSEPEPSATPAGRAANRVNGDLALQNHLYRAALGARDRGDDEEAVAVLSELLDRYPGSPLAAEARRERALALGRLHRADH